VLPAIEQPKGGGAARAISERFRANAATGTGALELSLGLSPGRGGFGPALALSYDSGSGNSHCGLGWSCGTGSIARKTSKGVPVYREDADSFMLAGGEELVPASMPVQIVEGAITFVVQRYLPCVERAFVRIERWRELGSADAGHWRTYSPEDVRSIYGRTPSARIFDPARVSHVFEWLLEEQYDGRGNAIRYVYKPEDLIGVDLSRSSESHRRDPNGPGAGGARYLKRILYGNATPLEGPSDIEPAAWRFEVVFDYGEHLDDRNVESAPWRVRADPFSRHRPGFELRTYRLLRRVLMFHRFPELGANAAIDGVLVRSTVLSYEDDPVASKLMRVEQRGHRDGVTLSLPPVELEYSRRVWNERLRFVQRDAIDRHRSGADEQLQWVDLDGEGLPGLLVSTPEAFWYQRPEGQGRLGAARLVEQKPVAVSAIDGVHQLLDLQGDGRMELVRFAPSAAGYFEQTAIYGGSGRRTGFDTFRAFESVPNVALDDANVRFVDLDGDGLADILITEGDHLVCYRSKGAKGFEQAFRVPVPLDERLGPRIIFADTRSGVFAADMTGDGLSDLVRIEARRICYWPNLGHGRFGPRVTMSRAPVLDAEDAFDARRVRLVDLAGSGHADLVYLRASGVVAHLNEAGNGWSEGRVINGLPLPDRLSDVAAVDLLGRGTSCLVWTSSAPSRSRTIAYVELFGRDGDEQHPPSAYKPNLLIRVANNLGAETRIRYTPSTRFYLESRGTPSEWVTRLHFPVQVVDRVEHEDFISDVRLVQRFAYHDGYYDPEERELNGFGYVEEWDEESYAEARGSGRYDDTLTGGRAGWVPPIYTRTWFHTGASRERNALESALLARARGNPGGMRRLAVTVLPPDLDRHELADACRALRGQQLRQEVYGLDESALEREPYLITETQVEVRRLLRGSGVRRSVFTLVPRESRALQTERDGADVRVLRELALEVRPEDARYGHVYRAATIAFGRDQGPAEQQHTWVQSAEMQVEHHDVTGGVYRIRQTLRTRTWEVLGVVPARDVSIEDLRLAIDAAATRLLTDSETLYWNELQDSERPRGESDPRGFVRRLRGLAVPVALQNAVYGADTPGYAAAQWTLGGHELIDGDVWAPSPVLHYLPAAQFSLPNRTVDPFGNATEVTYDAHSLFAVRAENAAGHVSSSIVDYVALAPREVIDANANHVEVELDALGAVTRIARKGKDLGGGLWEGRTLANPHATYAYAREEWMNNRRPSFVRAEIFTSQDPAVATSMISFTYADGAGQEVLTKSRVLPGPAPLQDPVSGALILDVAGNVQLTLPGTPRWVGSGRVVPNNKGEPLKEYESYFSSVAAFDREQALVFNSPAAIFHYDPLSRLTRTQFPDGTESRVARSTWSEVHSDRSDTVAASRWAADAALSADAELQRALALSLAHAGTPLLQHLDALGRVFRTDENNGTAAAPELHTTTVHLDIGGRTLQITDARGNIAGTVQHDLLGRVLRNTTADGGTRWLLPDVGDQPVRVWNQRQESFEHSYDALRRPLARTELRAAGAFVRSFVVYGEALGIAAARALNLLGRAHQIYDGAGAQTIMRADFDGRVVESRRRLRRPPAANAPLVVWAEYAQGADWAPLLAAPDLARLEAAADLLLDAEVFPQRATFDAVGRVETSTTPDASVAHRSYGADGRIARIEVGVRGAAPAPFVGNISYDAEGRRVSIAYGQGVATRYDYDRTSRRLISLRTERAAPGTILQDLRYTHDAAGNIVAVLDGAQPATFFDNAVVSADRSFEYDARHRLVFAQGRCHPGQQPANLLPPNRQIPHSNDATTLERYAETYVYDPVGNIMETTHRRGVNVAWRRRHQYALASNRLISTSASMAEPQRAPYADPAVDPGYLDRYAQDVHGNITAMPGLGANIWNADDQLVEVGLGGGGDAFYSYDSEGERVRKIIRRANGAELVERIYLDGWERYERRLNDAPEQVIETLHVSDETRRIALVETRTTHDGAVVQNPAPRPRYQLDDHLGTCTLELDGSAQANVLTYEEYYPYGATSYRATRAGIDLSPKRYRYTTKERDEETGLDYFGQRYYAPWLARWIAADPDPDPGESLYAFGALSPQGFVDPDGGKEIPIGFIYTLSRTRSDGVLEVYVGKAADIRQRLLAGGSKQHHHFLDFINRKQTKITTRTVYADLTGALGKGATRQTLDAARNSALLVAEQDELDKVRKEVGKRGRVANLVEALADDNIDAYRERFKVKSAGGPARVLKKSGQVLEESRLALVKRGKSPEFLKLRRSLKPSPGALSKKVPVVTIAIVSTTLVTQGAEAATVELIDSFNPLAIVGLSLKDKYDADKAESAARWEELFTELAHSELESIILESQVADLEQLPELAKSVDKVVEELRRDVERGLQWERENIPAPRYGR
jgi:RHS repeat-associated protein